MASVNRTYLLGNLTRDPELRSTPQGKAVCEFTVAVEKRSSQEGEKGVDFIPVTVWEKQAEACAKHLRKGSLVHVEGRINQERWETEGGKKHSRLAVVAGSVQFLPSGAKATGKEATAEPDAPVPVGVPADSVDFEEHEEGEAED